MVKKQISRKEFVERTITGIAGLGFISNRLSATDNSQSQLKKVGNTGIMVSPVGIGSQFHQLCGRFHGKLRRGRRTHFVA